MATVDAIHMATIQVLAAEGLALCTTTRVAERAGVSVGSLYQYYPNRRSLLAAVLGRHLDHVAVAVEQACITQRRKPIADMAHELVHAFLGAKLEHPSASKALYAVAEEHGGTILVAHAKERMQKAVASMLDTATDARFDDLNTASLLTMSAMIGPAQALLEDDASAKFADVLRAHLCTLIQAYLRAISLLVRTGKSTE
ncbi:TetR/AcrR family transcriptional regulator [Enterobacter sp. RHBSTW-00175]|uniref:TetR/AcrR family transcriptional regulator n=1 Tax=Enterobacter sp. RHBSTW-00175 TaxID=2742639 RepID=UPI0015E99EE7|nr:TetR/AcrR family transcriptional regulator [Enterobacter sp. RHBSTW-00175]QMR77484.1 TetR family transcriptional regulator [Enterobacter sp. RHBSTW-00175]